MASSSKIRSLTVEQLIEAVRRLSPAERREFQLRLIDPQEKNGHSAPKETLTQSPVVGLSETAERRLRTLIARSEQGKLTAKELAEYHTLAEGAKQIDAAQAESLADMARRSSADPKTDSRTRRRRG